MWQGLSEQSSFWPLPWAWALSQPPSSKCAQQSKSVMSITDMTKTAGSVMLWHFLCSSQPSYLLFLLLSCRGFTQHSWFPISNHVPKHLCLSPWTTALSAGFPAWRVCMTHNILCSALASQEGCPGAAHSVAGIVKEWLHFPWVTVFFSFILLSPHSYFIIMGVRWK